MNRQVVRWNLVDGAAAAFNDPEPRVAGEARALKHEATGGGVVVERPQHRLCPVHSEADRDRTAQMQLRVGRGLPCNKPAPVPAVSSESRA